MAKQSEKTPHQLERERAKVKLQKGLKSKQRGQRVKDYKSKLNKI